MIIANGISDASNIRWICHSYNETKSAWNHSQQTKELKTFKNSNDCNILVVIETLKEGFDFAQISVIAFCAPISSPVKMYQYIGRGVRHENEKESENITCDIIFHVDYPSKKKFSDLYEKVKKEELVKISKKALTESDSDSMSTD